MKRGNTPTTPARQLMEIVADQEDYFERLLKEYAPDITLTEANLYDYDRIVRMIHEIINT